MGLRADATKPSVTNSENSTVRSGSVNFRTSMNSVNDNFNTNSYDKVHEGTGVDFKMQDGPPGRADVRGLGTFSSSPLPQKSIHDISTTPPQSALNLLFKTQPTERNSKQPCHMDQEPIGQNSDALSADSINCDLDRQQEERGLELHSQQGYMPSPRANQRRSTLATMDEGSDENELSEDDFPQSDTNMFDKDSGELEHIIDRRITILRHASAKEKEEDKRRETMQVSDDDSSALTQGINERRDNSYKRKSLSFIPFQK